MFVSFVIEYRVGMNIFASLAQNVFSVVHGIRVRKYEKFGWIILFRVPFDLPRLQVQKDDLVLGDGHAGHRYGL